MPQTRHRVALRAAVTGLLTVSALASGCSKLTDVAPATIEPARAALSPRPATAPAGEIIPLGAGPEAAVVDAATG
ncbi:MAG: hypothetical protein WAO90_16690, partial [Mycobacterium sp.]